MGLSSHRARSSASSPQGYQSTGLFACWRRYGEEEVERRFRCSDIPDDVASFLVERKEDRRLEREPLPAHPLYLALQIVASSATSEQSTSMARS